MQTGLSLINGSSCDLGPSYKNKLTSRKDKNRGKVSCLQVSVLFHVPQNLLSKISATDRRESTLFKRS